MVTNLLIWLEFKNNNLFQSILLLRDSEGCPYFPLICNCEIMFDKTIRYIVFIFVVKKFKGDISNFPFTCPYLLLPCGLRLCTYTFLHAICPLPFLHVIRNGNV